jgi:hypothetical protein
MKSRFKHLKNIAAIVVVGTLLEISSYYFFGSNVVSTIVIPAIFGATLSTYIVDKIFKLKGR